MKPNRLLIRLSKQSWHWMALSIALSFSSAIFNGIGITLIIPLILTFLGIEITETTSLPPILNSLISAFNGVPESVRTLVMLGTVIVAILLKNLTGYINAISSSMLTRRFTSKLRGEGFRLLMDVDIQYFSEKRLGELMNYINGEVGRVSSAINSVIKIISSVISILVFLSILIMISWELTLLSTLMLGFITLLNQTVIKFAKKIGEELSASAGKLSSRSIEVLSGIRLVKSVANEDEELRIINKLIERRENAQFKSQLAFSAVGPINETLSIFAVIGLAFISNALMAENVPNYSSLLITYLFVMTRMLPFIGQLNGARNQLANSSASIHIVEEFLNRESKNIMQSGTHPFDCLNSTIKFKNLWFRYPLSDRWSLKDVDLSLSKGTTLALVGASGAGKSTLADLLSRFYDPDKGTIEIDGVNLKDLDIRQYRKKIGIVSQDTFLFNTSIKENIRYGCSSATDEEVFQAAERANAIEFIKSLPQGFETMIGDRGVLLSGGQRQRIAIARALVQNPEILILDEATSALDTVSEKLVQAAIEELSAERTTLVIAHRLSTIQNADQIAVFDKGEVVEVGNHKELLDKGGYYSTLCSMQFLDEKQTVEPQKAEINGFRQMSYEIRAQLNQILQVMDLLNYVMTDTPSEVEELQDLASQSAQGILRTLSGLEKHSQVYS